ncbi:MAG TPA: hypothetical protein VM389_03610 [Phycisphaerae bacterium]|nr:hypothetical protein [Phycisphaerae bacterium]
MKMPDLDEDDGAIIGLVVEGRKKGADGHALSRIKRRCKSRDPNRLRILLEYLEREGHVRIHGRWPERNVFPEESVVGFADEIGQLREAPVDYCNRPIAWVRA